MKQHNALALFALLCLSRLALEAYGQNNSTKAVGAKLSQRPGDGYSGGGAAEGYPADGYPEKQPYEAEEEPYDGGYEEPKCPDAQPADSVKDVYRAYSTFSWRELAAYAAEQQGSRRVQASPLNKAEAVPAASIQAHVAALSSSSSGKGSQKPAKPAAVDNPDFLLPTYLDREGSGFAGTYDGTHYPPSEALAVGPHPTDDELVFVLHAINGQAEIFPAEKHGDVEESVTPTKVPLMDMAAMTKDADMEADISKLEVARVAAFYDEHRKRYVLMWSTYATGDVKQPPPLFVASSLTQNPLGAWVIWALDLRPDVAQGVTACAEQPPNAFHLANLQASYSKDGIFIGGAATCTRQDASGNPLRQELSALYVLPKHSVCEPPSSKADEDPDRSTPTVFAAVYFAHRAWYRSVAEGELVMVDDKYEPFNSYVAPARPQDEEDLHKPPLFAMKVSHSHLSVASLTDEPLEHMCSVETAPLIRAVVVGKGADFSNYPDDEEEGQPVMPQPGTEQKLTVAGLGMPNNHGGVVYWATQSNGLLYITTGEFWGANDTRLPSIYYAIIRPTDDICQLSREDQGMLASEDGLSLAYPVIAATKSGGAVLAYSYSGPSEMANGVDAFPGVATTEVGNGVPASGIDVAKQGPGSLLLSGDIPDANGLLPWGYNSAAYVCGNRFWFAVPIAAAVSNSYNARLWYGSWIGLADVSGPDASRA